MIAQTIQLSLAPVFVLVAIGNIMNILTTRLGRIVDRSRVLQKLHAETLGAEHDVVVIEMRLATQVSFFTAIALLMAALVYLLLETRLVAQTLRLPRGLLELHREDL